MPTGVKQNHLVEKTWLNPKRRFLPGWAVLAILATIIIGYAIFRAFGSLPHPGNIVYGHPIHASHDLNPANLTIFPTMVFSNGSPLPAIMISEPYFDFGRIGATDVVTREFSIQNTGKGPLLIYRAYTTCGCTTADFTAAEIPPGKSALMTLTFNAGYHSLRDTTVRRGVMIYSNDPVSPETEIWVQATIR